ncbi:MAG: glycine cleavage system protein GcvH [Chloroflexota bacterium]|nr:glycine cleavage system protein GcvH [Chloroflexota bacterium]
MQVPDELRYTDDHEWLRIEGEEGTVGITAYAAGELGDVVFVELPAVGSTFQAAQSFGVIESVKTASDLYSPVEGEVTAVNDKLAERPELVNDDPYGDGWMIRLRVSDPSASEQLKDAQAYRRLIEAG